MDIGHEPNNVVAVTAWENVGSSYIILGSTIQLASPSAVAGVRRQTFHVIWNVGPAA